MADNSRRFRRHCRRCVSRWIEALLLAGVGLAAGCGQPGPPLPPSLNLPQAVHDFKVQRLGNQVHLGWTVPMQTTDGIRIHRPIRVNLCVWPGLLPGVTPSADQSCPTVLRDVAHGLPVEIPDVLTVPLARVAGDANSPGFVGLAVEFVNREEKGAGWSNFITMPLTPVSPPPAGLTATVEPDGVLLRWSPVSAPERVAVYRQELDASGQPEGVMQRLALLPASQNSYLDSGTVWNRTFVYRVRAVAGERAKKVESLDSVPVRVTPRDVFPPSVPVGVQAVLSAVGSAVDLSWEPVTAVDLAGYRVYRRSAGTDWVRLNSGLAVTPVYHDDHPAAGTAEYAVSAVDQAGNESQRSAPVTVSASP